MTLYKYHQTSVVLPETSWALYLLLQKHSLYYIMDIRDSSCCLAITLTIFQDKTKQVCRRRLEESAIASDTDRSS